MCTSAGVEFGYALLWTLLLSIIATISLQEMAARLGLISKKDLASSIADVKLNRVVKGLVIVLVFSAIVIGNTAYEAGNISGGALGLEILTGPIQLKLNNVSLRTAPLIIGLIAFFILWKGSIKSLQYILLGLVILMSMAFVTTAVITRPSFNGLTNGLLAFQMPEHSIFIIVGLIGTTVVPYNLFLHSALVSKKWSSEHDLSTAQFDTFLAVILGGLVSMSVLVAAASIDVEQVRSGADLASALKPVFGSLAQYLMGFGLFSAGLTSAITAPLAAAFVVNGLTGKGSNTASMIYKGVWISVLLFGVIASSFNVKPVTLIMFAQVTNGLCLPIMAAILLWIMNSKRILGKYSNSIIQNAVGVIVFLITLMLSYRMLHSV